MDHNGVGDGEVSLFHTQEYHDEPSVCNRTFTVLGHVVAECLRQDLGLILCFQKSSELLLVDALQVSSDDWRSRLADHLRSPMVGGKVLGVGFSQSRFVPEEERDQISHWDEKEVSEAYM
jgi:hypothetical protein